MLDDGGWVDIDLLVDAVNLRKSVDRALIEQIVADDDKGRYRIKDDRIRATQGHSIKVDLGLTPERPPKYLVHGTALSNHESIRGWGIKKQSRHHVHLTDDIQTAVTVGRRYGEPLVYWIEAQRMHDAGHLFYRTENGYWLVDYVPPEYLYDWQEFD